MAAHKCGYKFATKDPQPVTMPIVLSKAPPYKRLPSMEDSDSSSDEVDVTDGERVVKVMFEVRACAEEGEVRVTGNTASLGKWDIFSSVKLNRSTG